MPSRSLSFLSEQESQMGALDKVGDKISHAADQTARTGRSIAKRAAVAGEGTGADIKSLLKDLEAALKEGKDDDVGALRARLEARLADARSTYDVVQLSIREKLSAAASTTDEYVRDKPWETVGAVAAIAFLLGIIVGRS
jgi:ElaB/YqjD/DUF883 family membrane-anchored ribosome-binding protein